MTIPLVVTYPIVAITDVHGQRKSLAKLLGRLSHHPRWIECAVVFLGDYVDRGPDVRGTLDLILDLKKTHPGGVSAVMGNHDLALVRSAGLDGAPISAYWQRRYRENYDHERTFRSYLGRYPDVSKWESEIRALHDAMPHAHKIFLGTLPWLVEASGHLFLHGGLSPELEQNASDQVVALRERRWDDSIVPRSGTKTELLWQHEYPVWLGADKRLSENPLPVAGRVQVTGHKPLAVPDVNDVRIRLDTSGGHGDPLTACLLESSKATPVFIRSGDRKHPEEA